MGCGNFRRMLVARGSILSAYKSRDLEPKCVIHRFIGVHFWCAYILRSNKPWSSDALSCASNLPSWGEKKSQWPGPEVQIRKPPIRGCGWPRFLNRPYISAHWLEYHGLDSDWLHFKGLYWPWRLTFLSRASGSATGVHTKTSDVMWPLHRGKVEKLR